jgi:hypothetical protein
MKTRRMFASALAALALVTTSASFAEQPVSQQYRYGQQLDVAEVISLHEATSAGCSVVEAQMIYRDSTGELRSVTYLKQADNCHNQG